MPVTASAARAVPKPTISFLLCIAPPRSICRRMQRFLAGRHALLRVDRGSSFRIDFGLRRINVGSRRAGGGGAQRVSVARVGLYRLDLVAAEVEDPAHRVLPLQAA